MIIVYGTRMFGRADVIPGLGHVAVRFVHVMFMPLVPIETVFMTGDDRGVKLPFSLKAAMSGWIRGGALVFGIGSLIGGIAEIAEGEPLYGIFTLGFAVACFAAFPIAGLIFGGCSDSRRAEILSELGMEPAVGASHANPIHMNAPPAPMPQPQYGAPPAGGFGQPAPYGGYGAPPPNTPPNNYGAPNAAPSQPGGYGAPNAAPSQPGGYGAPQQGYGAPPAGYGAPPPQQQPGYGAPPQGYGAPPQGYGAPPPQQPQAAGYGGPPQHGYGSAPQGYGGPPQGYGGPPQGYGGPPPQGYGPPGYDPNRR